MQVVIEVDLQCVVEQVGRDHEPAERRQRDNLVGLEPRGQTAIELIRYAVRVDCELPAVGDDCLFPIVEPEGLGVFAGIDEQPAKKGRADEAIGSRRDSMGKERSRPLSQKWNDFVAEVIPGHERAQGDRRACQRPLHVGRSAVRRADLVERCAGFGMGIVFLQRWNSRHGPA